MLVSQSEPEITLQWINNMPKTRKICNHWMNNRPINGQGFSVMKEDGWTKRIIPTVVEHCSFSVNDSIWLICIMLNTRFSMYNVYLAPMTSFFAIFYLLSTIYSIGLTCFYGWNQNKYRIHSCHYSELILFKRIKNSNMD